MPRSWQLLLLGLAASLSTVLGIFVALANNIEEPPREGELVAIGSVAAFNLLWLSPWIIVQQRRADRLMLLIGAVIFAVCWLPFVLRSFHHPSFHAAIWKRSLDPNRSYAGYPAHRAGYMVTDIIKSEVCIGKNMPQIEEILGGGHFELSFPYQEPGKTLRAYFYSNKVLFDGCDKLVLCFENGVCTSAGFGGCD